MSPPRVQKAFTWFDEHLTPEQRLEAYERLSLSTKAMLNEIGYLPGTVPTELQMEDLYSVAGNLATKDLTRALSRAFVQRDLASVNELLRTLAGAELLGGRCDERVLALVPRVIQLALEEIEEKAYRAFREFPSAERYGACIATRKAFDLLGLQGSDRYPVNPWPRCRIVPPLGPGPYVVARGDTLSKIAKRYYGQENLWDAIYESNGYNGHPDLILPGLQLNILQGP
jgi:hypothetical protein